MDLSWRRSSSKRPIGPLDGPAGFVGTPSKISVCAVRVMWACAREIGMADILVPCVFSWAARRGRKSCTFGQ